MAELAAEFRSEQDYLGECNKNRLLAAAEWFAHAAIRPYLVSCAQGIRAWMSRSGDSIQSMRRNRFVVEQTIERFAPIQEIGPEATVWWVPCCWMAERRWMSTGREGIRSRVRTHKKANRESIREVQVEEMRTVSDNLF